MIKYSFYSLLLCLIFSCSSNNNNNIKIIEQYPGGKLKIVRQFDNPSITDTYCEKELYDNGQVKTLKNYIKNKLDGSVKTFSSDGFLLSEQIYKNNKLFAEYTYNKGKLNGPEKVYHTNGQLWTERILYNGYPWEVKSNFDSTGKPMDPGTLKDGFGTIKLYDKNAKLITIKEYRDGKEIARP